MRNLFLILFLFFPFVGVSQSNEYEIQLKSEVEYLSWKQEYPAIACKPSFYWMVTRSPNKDSFGRYLYRIYFFSNSRYCNGAWAGTYITGIYLTVDGYTMNINNPYWILFKETYQPSNLSFWSQNFYPSIQFKWSNISVN